MKKQTMALFILASLMLAGCRTIDTEDAKHSPAPDETPDNALHLAPLVQPNASHDGIRVRIPVPPGRLKDPRHLHIVSAADGSSLPVSYRVIQRWPDSLAMPGAGSPRLLEAIITAPIPVALANPLRIEVSALPAPEPEQPATAPLHAAAVLSPQWHVDSFFFGEALPLSPKSHWFDLSMLGYTQTALNVLPATVKASEHIDFSKPAPWLFDRPGLLFDLYLRSSDVTLLTAAEKESRRYISLLQDSGYFGLKPGDLKYVYARSLLYRWQLFGEEELLNRIRVMAELGQRWPMDGRGANFWTERHSAYAFWSLLTAWEITADEAYANKLAEAASTLLKTSLRTLADGRPAQCPAHSLRAHEGNDNDVAVCSPWMLALLVAPVHRYYQLSGNPDAAELLSLWHRYFRDTAVREIPTSDPGVKLHGMLLPWYLASNDFEFTDNGPYGDLEHSCNVAGALATTAVYDDSEPKKSRAQLQRLMESCKFNLRMWHRPGSDVQYGKPVWRLSPPRKFNWWFGTTQSLTWHLAQD